MAFEADGYVRYPGKTGGFENPIYDAEFKRSCDDYEGFWEEQAKEVVWMKKPKTVIDMSHPHLHRWFPDGVMNIATTPSIAMSTTGAVMCKPSCTSLPTPVSRSSSPSASCRRTLHSWPM
jgi:hypothetical protein